MNRCVVNSAEKVLSSSPTITKKKPRDDPQSVHVFMSREHVTCHQSRTTIALNTWRNRMKLFRPFSQINTYPRGRFTIPMNPSRTDLRLAGNHLHPKVPYRFIRSSAIDYSCLPAIPLAVNWNGCSIFIALARPLDYICFSVTALISLYNARYDDKNFAIIDPGRGGGSEVLHVDRGDTNRTTVWNCRGK